PVSERVLPRLQDAAVVGELQTRREQLPRDRLGADEALLEPILVSDSEALVEELLLVDRRLRIGGGEAVGDDEICLEERAERPRGEQQVGLLERVQRGAGLGDALLPFRI